jgi:putative phosphoribosyl transferase
VIFKSRKEAGQFLAKELSDYYKNGKSLVLGLPRGGVVVAEEVAKVLCLPLDVILLRKLPYPPQPELAVGAVAEHGAVYVNDEFQDAVREDPSWLEKIVREQRAILRERASLYRPHRHARDLKGKTAILVDDGIATGATMKVAIRAAHAAGAAKVVVAIPVAAPSSVRELEGDADQVVCLNTPEYFYAVGQAYQSFDQVTDEEVISILDRNP